MANLPGNPHNTPQTARFHTSAHPILPYYLQVQAWVVRAVFSKCGPRYQVRQFTARLQGQSSSTLTASSYRLMAVNMRKGATVFLSDDFQGGPPSVAEEVNGVNGGVHNTDIHISQHEQRIVAELAVGKQKDRVGP